MRCIKTIILPRPARDKHAEHLKKTRFLIVQAKHEERLESARKLQAKGGPLLSGGGSSRDFSQSRLTIGGSDEEADDEKVDEEEFAELYKKLVHLGGKL